MRVLIAPDSFGNTLDAVAAADRIAAGWSAVRPDDVLELAPQSDGGPGFVDVLASAFGTRRVLTVPGPLGDPTPAEYLVDGGTAYIECAQACGLHLLPDGPTEDTAMAASSRGVGELIADAVRCGATRVVVGLGGSSCTDAGFGIAETFGGFAGAARALSGIELVAATDVEHPLLGPHGAAEVFGPQKGASLDLVTALEERNEAVASAWWEATGRSVAHLPGAGAAGGIGAALLALGATRESGADVIAAATGQDAKLDEAGLVLTGEGRFDAQSLRGKVVTALAARAARHGCPTWVLAGQVAVTRAEADAAGVGELFSLVDRAGSVERAMTEAAPQLEGLAAEVAQRWSAMVETPSGRE
ncbi:glycerate kinase family protein [Tsukamurella soli]|uniref:glycerate kinase family protein n=1 Tax=Tsukamurella soli TaxID=644556 RepID=UPI0031EC6237